MFKRVERKRKRREEDEELGLDEDTKETICLNDTDSDESESGLEDENARSDHDDLDAEDIHPASEDDGVSEDPPMSVAEALKDPIYLISFDPTTHGCVLCKGKLIKSTGMVAAHKNANAHKRRFEHFRLLSANADPRSNAWELVRTMNSASRVQSSGTQELSKRALRRQVKQTALREKRKRHKELKAKAIAKKTSNTLSMTGETKPAAGSESSANLWSSLGSQIQPRKTRKKKRSESNTNVDTITEARNVMTKSVLRIGTSSDRKKPVRNPRVKTKKPS